MFLSGKENQSLRAWVETLQSPRSGKRVSLKRVRSMGKDSRGVRSLSRGGWAGELPASKWYEGQEFSVASRADEHRPLFALHTKTQDLQMQSNCAAPPHA